MTKTLLKFNTQKRLLSSCVCYATLAALSFPVVADDRLVEIVVTAQKREQNLQEVPISISAVTGEQLTDMGIDTGIELTRLVPGLVASGSSNSDQRFAIRGVGSLVTNLAGAETSVGVYLDHVYSGQTYLAATNFFDVDRIEVVKGPQGTLFGRNTSAGAISVTSKKADRGETYLDTRIGVGNESQQIYEAIANYSTSDDWGLRIGVQYQERDGTFKNTTTGNELNDIDDLIARIGFQRDWSDRFSSDMKLDYFHSGARGGGATVFDPDNYERSASVGSVTQQARDDQDVEVLRGSMTLTYDINDTLTLTSITSFLDTSLNITTSDTDVSPLALVQFDAPLEHTNFSQEFRLNGSSGSLDWFVGASIFYEDQDVDVSAKFSDFDLFPIAASFAGLPLTCPTSPFAASCTANGRETAFTTNETQAYGLYADATWQATDKLSLTVGGRFSYDDKEPTSDLPASTAATSQFAGLLLGNGGAFFLGPVSTMKLEGDESWSNFSPRFAATYQFNEAVMGHASVNWGYKAGGFNVFPDRNPTDPGPQQINDFEEETVLAYEAGIKSDFADGRARVNAAVFFMDYSDFQYEDVNAVGIPVTRTVDSAENKGFELEAIFLPLDGLELNLGYQYLDSEIKDGTAVQEGNPLPYAPEHTVSLRARYEFSIDLGLVSTQVGYSYVDDFFLDPNGDSVRATVRDHYTVDVRLGLTSQNEKWSVAVIGENITDERWFHTYEVALGDIGYPNMGELWRAEVTYRFD